MKYKPYSQSMLLKLFIGLGIVFLSLSTVSYAQNTAEYDCKTEEPTVIEAARNGKQAIIAEFIEANCTLPTQDGRGFSLYDLAALNGDEDMMSWLVEIGYAQEGRYSVQLYKLIQTGLRFLNFDAGVIDGKMNAATEEGITDFQKANKLKQTGEISPEWLGFFNRKLIVKTQSVLANLGFSSGGADGIIGPNTRTAMKAFRQERSMPEGDYGYIDDQLLYQIMMAENEATKQEIARREAERAARIKAQQAAQQQEIAKRRAQAQKEAQRAREQAEAAAREAQAQRIAKENALREEQVRLAQANQNPPQPATTKQSEIVSQVSQQTGQGQPTLEDQMARIQAQKEEQARIAAAKQAEIQAQQQAQREAEQARREAEERRRAEELAKQKAEEARRAEELAKAQALAAQREATKARTQAQQAFKAARSGQSVPINPDVQVGTPIKPQSPTALTPGGGFNKLSGRLKFVRNGGKLAQCLINEQLIDNAWCEPYYPSGENKQCEAVVSRTGIVVSLLCK